MTEHQKYMVDQYVAGLKMCADKLFVVGKLAGVCLMRNDNRSVEYYNKEADRIINEDLMYWVSKIIASRKVK
jgi:hypothetical protein